MRRATMGVDPGGLRRRRGQPGRHRRGAARRACASSPSPAARMPGNAALVAELATRRPDLIFADMRAPARPARGQAASGRRDGAICLRRRCRHGQRARRHSRPRRQLLGRAEHPIADAPARRPTTPSTIRKTSGRPSARAVARRARQRPASRRKASPASASTPPARWSCATATAASSASRRPARQRWDTIVWLDHRALAEADECTATAPPRARLSRRRHVAGDGRRRS